MAFLEGEGESAAINIEDLRKKCDSGKIDSFTFLKILRKNFQKGIYKPEDLTVHELEYLYNRRIITVDQYQEYCREKIRKILSKKN